MDTLADFTRMHYECESDLGAPAAADCGQLEWQGLGSAGRS